MFGVSKVVKVDQEDVITNSTKGGRFLLWFTMNQSNIVARVDVSVQVL